jgi:hypothetical protein
VQLAVLKVERWVRSKEPGHRLDRVPFTDAQRQTIEKTLAAGGVTDAGNGWQEIATSDGGRMRLHTKYLGDAPDFDALNILVEVLTPQISAQIHGLMRQSNWLLLPMAFAASDEAAATVDCDWPEVTFIPSAARLQQLLERGPFHWWRERAGDGSSQ